MFDMGPYYLTALVQPLGPIRRISGMTGTALTERTITSEKNRVRKFKWTFLLMWLDLWSFIMARLAR